MAGTDDLAPVDDLDREVGGHRPYRGRKWRGGAPMLFAKRRCGWQGEGYEAIREHEEGIEA